MSKISRNVKSLVRALGPFAVVTTSPCYGNAVAPPSITTTSPGGVSLGSGSYSTGFTDLEIGGDLATDGLKLVRSYDSGVPAGFSGRAGFVAQGWSHNLMGSISVGMLPTYPGLDPYNCNEQVYICEEYTASFYHNVVLSNRSIKFQNANAGSQTGNNVGIYQPLEDDGIGTSLVFTGAHSNGNFVFTDRDGTQYHFLPLSSAAGPGLSFILHPDQTRVDLNYLNGKIKSAFHSKGYGIIFDYSANRISKACAVNRANDYVTATSSCPGSSPSVQFAYASSPIVYHNGSVANTVMASSVDAGGQTTNYRYDDGGHLDCIKKPGQTVCQVENIYSTCQQDPDYYPQSPSAKFPELHLSEQVIRQNFAAAESLYYSYQATRICPEPGQFLQTVSGNFYFDNALAGRTSVSISGSKPAQITDPLGRITSAGHSQLVSSPVSSAGLLLSQTQPEGNIVEFGYDARGNRTTTTLRAKSGSGLANIVSSASYPSTCSNVKTCNKPTSVTDANGQLTSYTYDTTHGGVLTETGPAVGGVSPQKRFEYAQRYAWVKNSGGSYVQSATPVWVKMKERFCKTTAASGASCVGGASDEVVTDYDYGPDSGPNNLLVRGVIVTATNSSGALESQRTCYGYDVNGRKISETKPAANLGACS